MYILNQYLVGVYILNQYLVGVYTFDTLLVCTPKHRSPDAISPPCECCSPPPSKALAALEILFEIFQKIPFRYWLYLPVGTPPARRGFKARCCLPRWKGYLRWGPGLLWCITLGDPSPFSHLSFLYPSTIVYIISKIEQLLCVIKLRFKQSSR